MPVTPRYAVLWVVHPDPRFQRFLARLAGETALVCGPPDPSAFEGQPTPEAILLAVIDPTAALDFVHEVSTLHPRARWVLIRDPVVGDAELRRLFVGLDAERLAFPPDPPELRAAIRRARQDESGQTLAERRRREAVASRFARYFRDLELPDTEQVQLAGRGLVVRGEPGTGRLLFARAAHLLASGDHFLHLPCDETTSADELRARLTRVADARNLTICLEALDGVAPEVQRELLGWIELGVPATALTPSSAPEGPRWIALVSEAGALLPELTDGLAAFEVHLPPLRERLDAVRPFAEDTAAQWTRARGIQRRFSPDALAVLEAEAWPGNLRELEAAVLRLMASGSEEEIGAQQVHDLLPPTGPATVEATPASAVAARAAEAARHLPARHADGEPALPTGPAEPEPDVIATDEPRPALKLASTPLDEAALDEAAEGLPEVLAEPEESAEEAELHRLSSALSHELRNPLVSIRTFAELLPERQADPEFQTEFQEAVRRDVARMEERLGKLERFAALGADKRAPVDVTALLEELLDERRERFARRRLLVLRELETRAPFALGDAERLRFVFESLLAHALRGPEGQGDLYVASLRHQEPGGPPALRILFRFHDGERSRGEATGDVSAALRPALHSLDLWFAEAALTGEAGSLRMDTSQAGETVAWIELPVPERGGDAPR